MRHVDQRRLFATNLIPAGVGEIAVRNDVVLLLGPVMQNANTAIAVRGHPLTTRLVRSDVA